MTKADLYAFDDYRTYIKSRVKAEAESWGIWARLAKAAGCQASYLSQAMKGKVQLTPEHIHGLAKYWVLTESETDFFLLLLEYDRAGNKELRQFFAAKIQNIQREREDLSKRFQHERVEAGAKEALYYSAWHWSAIHVIVTIPEYQTVAAISERLCLPRKEVERHLEKMKELGFVAKEGARWIPGQADVHIPKNSVMIGVHHNNWRVRAVADAADPERDGLHFTGVYSLSRDDARLLKQKMLELIETSRKVVAPSKEEEIVCFNCDLFKV